MRLKSIMLHGFKSFHRRTEIPLGTGITGIVGPNGCGKSNVSDALRWVLGEGNIRNLRGENILDVIFKGSGSAMPAGFAEVGLIVDNEDRSLDLEQTEIAVTRRVFRSGDSEFLINHQACRLKDIRNLFLGTGMGSHGYSVIERNMVDAVLSEHDDQRRLFFEEAAGISKYKLQRREASRKLESTDADLLRIDDILREIEREVRSLARQVGKARRHTRLLDQIRDLEVDLAVRRWNELDARLHDCRSDRDQWSDHREKLAAELDSQEAELEALKLRLLESERALEETRRVRETLLAEQADKREEVSVLSTRIQGWDQRDGELARRISEESEREALLRERISEREPGRRQANGELARQQELVEEAQGVFDAAEAALRAAREEEARTVQLQMEQLLVRTQDAKEIEGISKQLEHLEIRRGAFQTEREGLTRRSEALEETIQRLEGDLASVDAEHAEALRTHDDLEGARSVAETEREVLRQRREDIAQRRASIESRLNLLREQKARHEGFDSAIRFLLERRGSIGGMRGVVGELVSASSDLDTAAAEAYLADAVQWVVVDDDAAAMRALEMLRAEGQGGVTFFPLRENSNRFPGFETPGGAPLPIRAPEGLDPLVLFLSARTRPAASREEARGAARGATVLPVLRFLSPEGEIYATEGWIHMPGGHGAAGEIIERTREIPRLEDTLERLHLDERAVREALAEREKEIEERSAALEDLTQRLDSLNGRRHRLDRDLSERRVERNLMLEEAERTLREIAEIESRIHDLTAESRAIQERLGVSDASGREADERHEAARRHQEECGGKRDLALEQLSRARTEGVRLENAVREIENAQQRDREEADRLAAGLLLWQSEREEAFRLREEAIVLRASTESRLQEIDRFLQEVAERAEARRKERDEGLTLASSREHEIRELRGEVANLQERLHDDQVREVEIRSEMERIRERIRQEFRVNWDEEVARRREAAGAAEPAPAEPEPVESARERIEALRAQLGGLGLVNFLATEEYARQKERLLFHREQQADLKKARQDLIDTIQRINESAGRMFRETFDQARDQFRTVFEFLFPGGESDIRLLGDDPLEGEIEIMARPSGKKLEAVRLLSTGERSLTAVALLFGIYLVKPSPFCVLDEVDAPLDDANIGRFVTLLRHFSERTQFVVITHNKRTMEAADRLYGVTMQEAGISRIVSVRLTEAGAELEAEITEDAAAPATRTVEETAG